MATLTHSRLRQDMASISQPNIFGCILFNENCGILIKISLKYVCKGPVYNNPALVQIMGWRRKGDRPFWTNDGLVWWRTYASLGLNICCCNSVKKSFVTWDMTRSFGYQCVNCAVKCQERLVKVMGIILFKVVNYVTIAMQYFVCRINLMWLLSC